MGSGSSDGRQGAASPQAPAASSPLTAEDAERFASVLKPMWELDSAPQPAAPLAPPSKPKVAPPVVTVTARQASAGPPPAVPLAPAPVRNDSSHEWDALAQMPRGPSAAPEALGTGWPSPELEPEGASAVAVQPHLPPRRQQISEPRHSVEVDAPPPQTVPSPFAHGAHAAGSTGAMAQAAHGGPTVEQLRARAARSQPTMVLNKSEVSFPGRRRNRAVVIGLGMLVLGGGAAAALFVTSSRTAAAGSAASSSAPSAMTAASASPSSPGTQATVAAAAPAPADTSGTPTRAGALGTAAAPGAAATTTASPAASSASTGTSMGTGTTAGSTHPAATGAAKAAPAKHKTPGTIVRSSPF